MRKTVFVLLFLSLLLVGGMQSLVSAETPSTTTTVTYTADSSVIANPERGFYRHRETFASNLSVWSATGFDNAIPWATSVVDKDKTTMLLCLFYLDTFVTSPISQPFLDHIQTNLDNVRAAGRKCVMRFAYTNVNDGVPHGDATKAQILSHITQLTPILQANSDIIAVAQTGFVGIWGEWYYTDHFADPSNPALVSAAQYADRYDVVTALLDALPSNRMVQIRTPLNKMEMFGTTTPIAPADAHNGSYASRSGGHNDCFINGYGDLGTFRDWNAGLSALDRGFWQDESIYMPMGGETCTPSTGQPPDLSCANALSQFEFFHFSYFNTDFYVPTLQSWETNGCLDDIQNKLGYRFVMQQGTYPDAATAGNSMTIQLSIENEGYAAPFNPRDVVLVLRSVSTSTEYTFPLSEDPRFWLDGMTHVINQTIGLPAGMPADDYELLLWLPDPDTTLAARPDYAIHLANQNVWEAATGYNDLLHTVEISANTPTSVGLADTAIIQTMSSAVVVSIIVVLFAVTLATVLRNNNQLNEH